MLENQCNQRLKHHGIDLPPTNNWSLWFGPRLQALWKSSYMLENQHNQSHTHGWEVKVMLFNTTVTQVLLCRLEVWGDTITLNTWNEIVRIRKYVFHKDYCK